jgi:tRNA (guanine26-N2/guanine27-N2)-dimethyltransferase
MRVREGRVEIAVPEESEETVGESVFYNPNQELNRDLTVAVLRAYRERNAHSERYLDAMAASGVRGVRAAANGWEVTLNDHDPRAVDLCERNLALNGLEGEVVKRNANALMHDRRFDVIDLDPYGTPIPFADAAFANTNDLVCVTATDTAPLCGAHKESGIRKYGAVPQNTEYHREMGLRVLLSALCRTAARYDVGVTPLFSHATRHYVRTYLELSGRATDADRRIESLGYVHHCEDCLHRESETGLIGRPPEACRACGGERVRSAGPLWLRPTADPAFVAEVAKSVSEDMGSQTRALRLLETTKRELAVPTHFDQHRLYKLWGEPATAMDEFLEALREAGFSATRAHYGGTTFKTDATAREIREATRGISPD